MFVTDDIPDLRIDRAEGKLISLAQGYEDCRIEIHPIHVRYIVEQFGLIETSDPDTAKVIASFERRLSVLRDRARRQAEMLRAAGNQEHLAYAEATVAIADEYCADQAQEPRMA